MYPKLSDQLKAINSQIAFFQKKLRRAPVGKLICCHQETRVKWYVSFGDRRDYLPKSNRAFAKKLAEKEYFLRCIASLKARQKILTYINRQNSIVKKPEELLAKPGYRELLSEYCYGLNKDLSDWANYDYESNPEFADKLVYKTIKGHMVRSKSELIIANLLFMHKIPYRYEAKLEISDQVYYPDFTIRHPMTGKYFYWEHLGMMDIPSYQDTVFRKLHVYSENGIYPMHNLILTSESKNTPLDTGVLEGILRCFFDVFI